MTTMANKKFLNPFDEDSVREKGRALLDRWFRLAGLAATFFGLAMLVILLGGLLWNSYQWFQVMPGLVEAENAELRARVEDAEKMIQAEAAALEKELQEALAEAGTEEEKQEIRDFYEKEVKPRKLADLDKLVVDDRKSLELGQRPSTSPWSMFVHFLTSGPSYKPQDAGIWPALLGSIWLGGITILLAIPLGVGAAVYLEEYSQKSRIGRMVGKVIQVNINNLAGVPSVVFGILGAGLFVTYIFRPMELAQEELVWRLSHEGITEISLWQQFLLWLPAIASRNVLGGGMTLALLTLPIVIVAAQEAIRAVPVSIRHGAYALGATQWQVTKDLVLPSSLPGILTGTILALSRAIGEAAPLVLFGALLFVNQTPGLLTRFTVLPMQIFGWADRPVLSYQLNAALGSIILVLALLAMNSVAIWLRARSRIRW